MHAESFARDGLVVVIGAAGGIGSALADAMVQGGQCGAVLRLSRRSSPSLDLTDEASIKHAADNVAAHPLPLRMVLITTGILHDEGMRPEKSWRELDGDTLARSLAINAIGPALIMKHFLPLLPRTGKSVFAALSARVGSIADNQLGGWYSYRAAKAALNQLLRTAAIELQRSRPEAICLALHPGTVATGLSDPFAKAGLDVQSAEQAATRLLEVIGQASAADTGQFFDQQGRPIPW